MEQEITLSTGVVLRVKQPSVKAIQDVQAEHERKRPQPPYVFMADVGRKVENPNDPDYVAARQAHDAALMTRILDISIATGTELVATPDGFMPPDGPELIESLEIMGFSPPVGKLARYAKWVSYFAAPTSPDWQLILQAVLGLVGTPESEVQEAMKSFPSDG